MAGESCREGEEMSQYVQQYNTGLPPSTPFLTALHFIFTKQYLYCQALAGRVAASYLAFPWQTTTASLHQQLASPSLEFSKLATLCPHLTTPNCPFPSGICLCASILLEG